MILYGKNVIREILKDEKRKIYEIYLLNDLKNVDDIIKIAQDKKIKINFVDKKLLFKKSGTDSHQGIVANVEGNKSYTIAEFLGKYKNAEKISVCILDSIQDPHNFGAVIRSCEIFGICGIIFSPKNNCDLTDVVYKSSSGALTYMDIVKVSNINNAINTLKENGFWVYGFDVNGTVFLEEVKFDKKTALVFGNEGSGMKQLVKKNCDYLVKIRQKGKINSLNVSNAVAIAAYELMKQT